ncbi:MAG TPA: DNA methyltransferase [Bacteroidales bacterium]|nr:DNA methyltransferase [Bacteroidales bacterium]HQB21438.1 DNA methyltransferase [Bacteroidales bacterium]
MAKEYKKDSFPISLLSDCEQLYQFKIDGKEKKKNIIPGEHYLNNLTGSEWTLHGKSVQIFNGAITEKRKKHGAAFPLSLAQHFINVYSKEGDTILDPFAGVGTTLDAANLLKRHSLGVELNLDFIKMFNLGIDIKDGIQNSNYQRAIFHGSARDIGDFIPKNTIDFILTSPPYSNLLNKIRANFADKDYKNNPYKNQSRKLAEPYSTDKEDLGNLTYEEYLEAIEKVFSSLLVIAKDGAYNAWVVRDYRDLDNHLPYVNLHGHLINVATKTGWKMWDLVIWDQTSQRKLVRLGGNKSRRYYFNIGHSFILVFRKNLKGEKF